MIYLASASPRRRELLTQINIEFELLTIAVDESLLAQESADDYVVRVTELKAQAAVAGASQPWPILTADTCVVNNGQILGKPIDAADAKRMLRGLSGKTHQVKTAVCVAYQGRFHTQVVTTDVTFRRLSATEIDQYWLTGEPLDKAGAYAIQGLAGRFVESINGSYSAVVGLPLMETEQLLLQLNL